MTELGMSVTERYPRKKRRLCLQPKTPTRPPKKGSVIQLHCNLIKNLVNPLSASVVLI